MDGPVSSSVATVDPHDDLHCLPQQQQEQHFYEQHHNPIIHNSADNLSSVNSSGSDTFSGVGHATSGGEGGPSDTVAHSLTTSTAFPTTQDSIVTTVVPPFSSGSPIAPPEVSAAAAAAATIAASTTASSTTHRSSSFMDSIFKKNHHRRRSSSVVGWNSDDDEAMDRTTVAPSEHHSSSFSGTSQERGTMSDKSAWLQKEHGKQKQVRICICIGVVACFIALGVILAFTYKEQWTRHDGSRNSAEGSQPSTGDLSPGATTREQLRQTIESTFNVNTTINPDPNLHKVFYGIDYTPRGSQEPDCKVNLGNVIEDIKILSQLTTRIRLYGMACRQTEDVMRALQYLDLPEMQVILTLWVDNNKASWKKQSQLFWNLIDNNLVTDSGASTSEMAHGQAVRSADTVAISSVTSWISGISVGNEVLFRNEDPSKKEEHVPLETLDAYIQEIRRGLKDRAASAALSSNPTYSARGQQLTRIPIFSSDLGRNVNQIVDKVDWVLSNIHPFFAYTSANEAADWAFANFKDETVKAAGSKPAMISEVGWPSGPSSAALGKISFFCLFCTVICGCYLGSVL